MGKHSKHGRKGIMGFLTGMSVMLLVTVAVAGAAISFFVTNPYSSVGQVGYVYEEPRFFGTGGFLGILEGPGSYGGSFRNQKVINISVLPEIHTEEFSIRTKDNAASVTCDVIVRVDPDHVKRIVEEFGATEWYSTTVRGSVLRTLRSTLTEGLSANATIDLVTMETVVTSALEGAMERRRIPVWVEGVLVRKVVWDHPPQKPEEKAPEPPVEPPVPPKEPTPPEPDEQSQYFKPEAFDTLIPPGSHSVSTKIGQEIPGTSRSGHQLARS